MTIPRLTTLTLGVDDLSRATAFYRHVFGLLPRDDYEGIAFFQLPGTWLIVYPKDKLAEDIGPDTALAGPGFNGITLGYNARSRDEVDTVFAQAKAAGARIAKMPQETFWAATAATSRTRTATTGKWCGAPCSTTPPTAACCSGRVEPGNPPLRKRSRVCRQAHGVPARSSPACRCAARDAIRSTLTP